MPAQALGPLVRTLLVEDAVLQVAAASFMEMDFTHQLPRTGSLKPMRFGKDFELHWIGDGTVKGVFTNGQGRIYPVFVEQRQGFRIMGVRDAGRFLMVMLKAAADRSLRVEFFPDPSFQTPTATFSEPRA